MSGDFPCCESGQCRPGCSDNAQETAQATTARYLAPSMYVVNLGRLTGVEPSSGMAGWLRLTIANDASILNSASISVDVRPGTTVYVLAETGRAPAPETVGRLLRLEAELTETLAGLRRARAALVVEEASGAVGQLAITPADDLRELMNMIYNSDSFEDLQSRVKHYRSWSSGRRP